MKIKNRWKMNNQLYNFKIMKQKTSMKITFVKKLYSNQKINKKRCQKILNYYKLQLQRNVNKQNKANLRRK